MEDNHLAEEKRKLLEQAYGHCGLGMYKEAVKDCEKLVELDANDPASYIELGFYCEKNKEIDRAKEIYSELMKRFPQHYASFTNMGHYFHVQRKRDDIAMVCYEKALELNPNDAWSFNNIGTILQNQGKWQEALCYYKKAYESAKNEGNVDYKIFHNLAWVCYRCKEYDNAWQIFNDLAGRYPDKASVFSDFGCVNYKMGRYEDAAQLFKEALSVYPDSRYYQRLYAVACSKCKTTGVEPKNRIY